MNERNLADDELCFERQYEELAGKYDQKHVRFERIEPPDGTLGCISFELDLGGLLNPKTNKAAKTYVGNQPAETSVIKGRYIVKRGHPKVRPEIIFDEGSYLYHPNSFGRTFCVGTHKYYSLAEVFERLIRACIYDSDLFAHATNYNSPACRSAIEWMEVKIHGGEFPILPYETLLKKSESSKLQRELPPPIRNEECQLIRRTLPPPVQR